jgi:hypothetical protein
MKHTPTQETVNQLAAAYAKALVHNPAAPIHRNVEKALNDCPQIVRACNSHEELIEVLKDQSRWTPGAIQEDPDYFLKTWLPSWEKRRNAAIAKAEGK